MCGIVGIVGQTPVNQRIYDALTVLQHRGQDAAGIMTVQEGELFVRKDVGLVRDVFQQHHMLQLAGNVGIGHVRYPTAGCDRADEAQPFYVNSPFGIGLGHNGNLTNAMQLTGELARDDRRHLNTSSDSEVLLNIFASELHKCTTGRLSPRDIFSALENVFRRCRGGFAVVSLIVGHGVVGFRDPHGIRPLVLGRRDTPRGTEWMLASESVALDMLGFRLVRDVNQGEAIYVDEEARLHAQQCVHGLRHTPCIFEYVYFARPDSIIDNISVHKARMRMGERLADKIARFRASGVTHIGRKEVYDRDFHTMKVHRDTRVVFVQHLNGRTSLWYQSQEGTRNPSVARPCDPGTYGVTLPGFAPASRSIVMQ